MRGSEEATFSSLLFLSSPVVSCFLYPLPAVDDKHVVVDASTDSWSLINKSMSLELEKLLQLSRQLDSDTGNKATLFSGAWSLALTYIHRMQRTEKHTEAGERGSGGLSNQRILLITASEDAASQYVPIMNCIFSSQKAAVAVNVCNVGKSESLFFQQAAYLTKGIYFRVLDVSSGLLQQLLMLYLPDNATLKILEQPEPTSVDFCATCFCHTKIVSQGYVCPVCLASMFFSNQPIFFPPWLYVVFVPV